jgi:hypothetical protein
MEHIESIERLSEAFARLDAQEAPEARLQDAGGWPGELLPHRSHPPRVLGVCKRKTMKARARKSKRRPGCWGHRFPQNLFRRGLMPQP